MATVGTFCIVKNERRWIGAHLSSWLPFVDEMVLFDGASSDGTLEIIHEVRKNHPAGNRIKLYEQKDCNDLDAHYQAVFNECLHSLKTDYAIFAHPDMMLDDPGDIGFLGDAIAYTTEMRSFAGEPDGQLYEIKTGRADRWKNVYRIRNPDLGLHYFGAYGAANEDCYFSKITGKSHEYHGSDFAAYPYEVKHSSIRISHFSDVRPLSRRLDRMIKCLINQGKTRDEAHRIADVHPRVTFKDGHGFKFEPCEYPSYLREEANV